VLLVEADHPGWIQILQTKQAGLLQTVQKRYPELNVRGIAFTLSRGPLAHSAAEKSDPEKPHSNKIGSDVSTDELLPEKHKEPKRQDNCVLSKDDELYVALKNLEECVRVRNRL
jgi:hypothetical protein